ncbi:hypothetical protein [Bradyrhizobium sp. SZCCHNRI20481]|uniref:hypothetical protein n=1 Tax=Bradyrhizobium sp. SZCCHNRI20481 TaxID=3057286 RepID=UPI002916CFB8|nr:hypothetical protein [Bradyrhizobium sp. SZCCHNRI20481]
MKRDFSRLRHARNARVYGTEDIDGRSGIDALLRRQPRPFKPRLSKEQMRADAERAVAAWRGTTAVSS